MCDRLGFGYLLEVARKVWVGVALAETSAVDVTDVLHAEVYSRRCGRRTS